MIKRRQFISGLGSAAAWPVVARAQQPAMPVIGYLSIGTENAVGPTTAAFRRGLSEEGYAEGRNVEILYRWAETRFDRLPALAADLVRRRVVVIVATAVGVAARAAKSATAAIPIVFVTGADPVELGLVASLNRPGGNLTGVYFLTQALIAKRFELLHEIVPAAAAVGFLVNPTNPSEAAGETVGEAVMREAEAVAHLLGVRLVTLNAGTPSEIEAAFTIVSEQRISALLVSGDPLFTAQHDQLAALATRHAVAAIYAVRENVDAGGLLSYGPNLSDAFRLVGNYVGLKGERPGDLPVQQSTKIEMVLNLRTAKALGLTVPQSILLRADEVIE